MDQIVITGARLSAHIGVTDEERAEAQDLIFDIRMSYDIREAAKTDDFSKTVCYATVVDRIEDILNKPFRLIETVAETTAEQILNEFPVSQVFVRVAKPGAFPKKRVESQGVWEGT